MNTHARAAILADGTITAVVAAPPSVADGSLHLVLALPRRIDAEWAAGRFLLARCGAQNEWERTEQWSIYLRRPLYVAGGRRADTESKDSLWRFSAPTIADDAGYAWLAQRQAGETVNVTGLYGNGFPLPPLVSRLLLLADPARVALLSPLIDEALDRGGQVSLLLIEGQPGVADVTALRAGLPLSVEFHMLGDDWAADLAGSLRWADQVCAALPARRLSLLAEAARQSRLRLESGFIFALVESDLVCGYGACLACVVPLAGGSLTRACIHGPVFDLLELAGKG